MLLAIAAAALAQASTPPPQSSQALHLYGELISNSARFVEEAVCYGVDPEQASRTLMKMSGEVQQKSRDKLVALHGEPAVKEKELFITFGPSCQADRGPPYYWKEYMRVTVELRKFLPLDR